MASVPFGDGDAPSDKIRIAFTLTKADYLRAYRRNFWRTLWWLVVSAPLIVTSPVWRDPSFRFCFMHGNFSGPTIVGSVLIAAAIVFFFLFRNYLPAGTQGASFGPHRWLASVRSLPSLQTASKSLPPSPKENWHGADFKRRPNQLGPFSFISGLHITSLSR